MIAQAKCQYEYPMNMLNKTLAQLEEIYKTLIAIQINTRPN